MDRAPHRIVWVELLVALLLWLSQVGLPVLDIQPKFWFGLCVWFCFLVISVHLCWILLPTYIRAAGRIPVVVILALAIVFLVYPGLKRRYRQEHPKSVAAPPASLPSSPAIKTARAAAMSAKLSLLKLEPPHSTVEHHNKRITTGNKALGSPPTQPKQPAGAPTVIQQGQNNIAQVGDNNQVTIIPRQQLLLNEQQKSMLTQALRGFGGRKLKIILNRGTEETWTFTRNLATALRDAGVNVEVVPGIIEGVPVPPGVSFLLYKTKEDWPFVSAIVTELVRSKVVTTPIKYDESGDDDVPILRVMPY